MENLDPIFKKASLVLKSDGLFYISELHPFKQYLGSKAKFDNGNEIQELEVYKHPISDYLLAAKKSELNLIALKESFDEDTSTNIPRLISFLFQR